MICTVLLSPQILDREAKKERENSLSVSVTFTLKQFKENFKKHPTCIICLHLRQLACLSDQWLSVYNYFCWKRWPHDAVNLSALKSNVWVLQQYRASIASVKWRRSVYSLTEVFRHQPNDAIRLCRETLFALCPFHVLNGSISNLWIRDPSPISARTIYRV